MKDERPNRVLQLLLDACVTRFGRRHDGVFPLNELMFHPIVGVLFELLECHKRSRAHSFRIPSPGLFQSLEREFARNGGKAF